jgi:hypothetical protein
MPDVSIANTKVNAVNTIVPKAMTNCSETKTFVSALDTSVYEKLVGLSIKLLHPNRIWLPKFQYCFLLTA